MLWKIWFWEFPGNFMPFPRILKVGVRNSEAPESGHFPGQPMLQPHGNLPPFPSRAPSNQQVVQGMDSGSVCTGSGPECYRGRWQKGQGISKGVVFPTGRGWDNTGAGVRAFFQLCQRLRKALQRRPWWARHCGWEHGAHLETVNCPAGGTSSSLTRPWLPSY